MQKFNKLSKAEMKQIAGGIISQDGNYYICKCNDSPDIWSAFVQDGGDVIGTLTDEIYSNCPDGGWCDQPL